MAYALGLPGNLWFSSLVYAGIVHRLEISVQSLGWKFPALYIE